jgi:NTP pyrophosphatase (non-canonical NTP hydrolase)
MSEFEKNFKRCVSIDSEDKKSNLSISLIKLGEETGELNEAFLRSIDYKKSNKETSPIDDMKEECIDTMIMSFVIANKLGMSLEEINALLNRKIVKWESKYVK